MGEQILDPELIPNYNEDWARYCENPDQHTGRKNAASLLARYLVKACQVIVIDSPQIARSRSDDDRKLAKYLFDVLKLMNDRLMIAFLEIAQWDRDQWEGVSESLEDYFEDQSHLMKALGFARSYYDLFVENDESSNTQVSPYDTTAFNQIFFALVNQLKFLSKDLVGLVEIIKKKIV